MSLASDSSSSAKQRLKSTDIVGWLTPRQQAVVSTLAHAVSELGAELYLVGGGVRDVLLGTSGPTDLDFATSLSPDQIRVVGEMLPNVRMYDIGERFGTIGFVFDDQRLPPEGESNSSANPPREVVEVTTFRSETYQPGSRHPSVVFGSSIDDDLARRDFTVNAIAVNAVTGDIVDPWFGRADLATGTLRAVGNASERFAEDPLRLLRAARFVAQLGFAVEPDTRAAMSAQAPMLAGVSGERVYHELTRLLCSPFAANGLDILLETGLLTIAAPELFPLDAAARSHPGVNREKDLWEHTTRVVMQSPPTPVLRWAALLHDAGKPVTRSVDSSGETHFYGHERVGADMAGSLLRRLNADRRTIRNVCRLVELHLRPAGYDAETWTDSAVRRLALEVGDVMPDLLDLVAADVTSARAYKQRAAAERVQGLRDHLERLEELQALADLQSPLDGNALMQLFDRPPGRWIADIKNHLRELVIDGELAADDVESAERIAREHIRSNDESGTTRT